MRASIGIILLAVTSLLIVVGRFFVPRHGLSLTGTYEPFAHIWIGSVGTLAVIYWNDPKGFGKWCLVSLIVLSVLEIAMFTLRG